MAFYHGFVNKLTSNGWLDHWTAFHIAGGAFICKIAQWLGYSDLWAVLWVAIIGVAWEIFEYFVEGTEEVYGTKRRWFNNTLSDLVVEIGVAAWIVL